MLIKRWEELHGPEVEGYSLELRLRRANVGKDVANRWVGWLSFPRREAVPVHLTAWPPPGFGRAGPASPDLILYLTAGADPTELTPQQEIHQREKLVRGNVHLRHRLGVPLAVLPGSPASGGSAARDGQVVSRSEVGRGQCRGVVLSGSGSGCWECRFMLHLSPLSVVESGCPGASIQRPALRLSPCGPSRGLGLAILAPLVPKARVTCL